MEFKDVAEVTMARSVENCNSLLNKGWTLLAVVAGDDRPNYVLGRAKGSDALPGLEKMNISAAALAKANQGL